MADHLRPVTQLPAAYRPVATLDLARDRRTRLLLGLAGIPLLIIFGALFIAAAVALSPQRELILTGQLSDTQALLALVALLLISVLVMAAHELVHGLLYGLFTGARPHVGFKGLYAYTAAPEWYIPRGRFLVVGLAPLVLLSLAGLAVMPFAPSWAVPALVLALILNAVGAVGDLYAAGWMLAHPQARLARDTGDAITLYAPAP
jgi:putative zincin peptidase